jgi:hypothetical protein
VELLIQELVVLVQRSEEYTGFMAAHMADAVAAEVAQLQQQQQHAHGAAARLARRSSSLPQQPETPATGREPAGVVCCERVPCWWFMSIQCKVQPVSCVHSVEFGIKVRLVQLQVQT